MMKPNDKAIKAALRATSDSCSAYQIQNALDAAYAAQFLPSEDYAGLVKWLRDKAESLSEIYPPEAEAADAIEAVLAERDALKAELASGHKWIQMRASVLEELAIIRSERDGLFARNKRMQETLRYWNDTYRYSPANEKPPILETTARLAPVDDEELVGIAANAIFLFVYASPDNNTEFHGQARAAIAAIRPHIEAAERERCAKTCRELDKRAEEAGVSYPSGHVCALEIMKSPQQSGGVNE